MGKLAWPHPAAGGTPAVPSTLRAELRDYQLDGYVWMSRLARWGAGACLADDMGLGKTVQTIAVLLAQAEMGPSIIIAPTSVCHNWENELDRFAPTLSVHRFGPGDRAALVGPSAPATCSSQATGCCIRKPNASPGASGRWPFSMKRKRSRTLTPAAPGPAARFRQPSAWRSRARPSKTALRIFGACST